MKTKTEYEPERKKGKARPPKIAEFTVSISQGVTERFKVSGQSGWTEAPHGETQLSAVGAYSWGAAEPEVRLPLHYKRPCPSWPCWGLHSGL